MHFEMSRIGGIRQHPNPTLKPKQSQGFGVDFHRDPQTGMLPRCGLGSARCVQKFDDSLNLQFTLRFALSLRSSSMRKPRDPLLKVVFNYLSTTLYHIHKVRSLCVCVCVCVDTLSQNKVPRGLQKWTPGHFVRACGTGANPVNPERTESRLQSTRQAVEDRESCGRLRTKAWHRHPTLITVRPLHRHFLHYDRGTQASVQPRSRHFVSGGCPL